MKIKVKNIFFSLVGALLLVSFAQAQERRTIPVSVVDKDGNFVRGLTAANFRGTYRNNTVEIIESTEDNSPRHVAIVVDISESTEKQSGWVSGSWNIAENVVASIVPDGKVGLYTFHWPVIIELEFTSDEEILKEKILELRKITADRKNNQTAFYNAVYVVGESLSGVGFAPVLYMITDAVDNSSTIKAKKAEDMLVRQGVRAFVFCIPPAPKTPRRPECSRFPQVSGGIVVPKPHSYIFSIGKLLKFIEPSHKLMGRVYKVVFEIPSPVNKKRKWKLEVVDERGKKMKGVKVFYPRLLIPLEEPSGN